MNVTYLGKGQYNRSSKPTKSQTTDSQVKMVLKYKPKNFKSTVRKIKDTKDQGNHCTIPLSIFISCNFYMYPKLSSRI